MNVSMPRSLLALLFISFAICVGSAAAQRYPF